MLGPKCTPLLPGTFFSFFLFYAASLKTELESLETVQWRQYYVHRNVIISDTVSHYTIKSSLPWAGCCIERGPPVSPCTKTYLIPVLTGVRLVCCSFPIKYGDKQHTISGKLLVRALTFNAEWGDKADQRLWKLAHLVFGNDIS